MKQKRVYNLRATLGAYGVKTKKLTTISDMVYAAKILFDLPVQTSSQDEILSLINRIQRKERWRLSQTNIGKLKDGIVHDASEISDKGFQGSNQNQVNWKRRSKKKRNVHYQDMVLPLSATDRRQLREYLPRLRELHQNAVAAGHNYARQYAVGIELIETSLRSGRM